jgi:hypothetical protein
MSTPVLTPEQAATPQEPEPARPADEADVSDATAAEPETAARPFTAWDVVGLLLLAWLMLAVNRLGVAVTDTAIGRSPVLDALTVAVMLAALGSLTVLVVWERPSPGVGLRSVVAFWRDPPRPAVSFPVGALLAIPVLGLYHPALFQDSDSARLVASIRYVQQGHFDYFADTQEQLLPHVLLGPAMLVAGMSGLKMAAALSVLVLGGVVAYVTYRLTGVMWASAAAVVGLFCMSGVFERVIRLPMYPTMLALGYFGGWLCYRAVSEPESRWRCALPAGICLALAQEAQGVGQLFLAVPLLVVVFAPRLRSGLLQLARVGAGVALVLIPRLAINLAEGGTSHLTTFRSDYWITEGYVVRIQNDFWFYQGISEDVGDYLGKLPGRFVETLGGQGWLVLVAAGLACLAGCRGVRSRLFTFLALAFFVLAITLKPVPPFARYYSPVWPGVAILAGVLVATLVRRRRSWLTTGALRAVGAGLSVALVVGASLTYRDAVDLTERQRRGMELQPFREFVAAIDDGKGVIGARAHVTLLSVTADLPTWGDQFLTEREYVTFLTWPSDAAVIAMMERHDIGWVLVHAMIGLETAYNNTWLGPRHQDTVRHTAALAQSPNFCRYMSAAGFVLYRLGACEDGYPG